MSHQDGKSLTVDVRDLFALLTTEGLSVYAQNCRTIFGGCSPNLHGMAA